MAKRKGPTPRPPSERFWDKVDKGLPTECWNWLGAIGGKGYGQIARGNLYPGTAIWLKAHRLSWEIAHGHRVPDGGWILHRCDNRACVNPAHLYLGTASDNAQDREDRGRGRVQHGEAGPNAKLTEAQVLAIIEDLGRVPRESQTAIGARYGVKQAQVSRIMLRQAWEHLWVE